jgi:hypothetical protein
MLPGRERDPAGVMTGDEAIRTVTVASVLSVAAVAAVISYQHAVTIVTTHGEPGTIGHLYPIVIDGLIIAASMVLLDAARHRETPPALSFWMLGAGIAATFAVNILAGVSFGFLGAITAAWPAGAFVGCYELLMMLVRSAARRQAKEPAAFQKASETDPLLISAETAFPDVATGASVPSLRQVQRTLKVGQVNAQRVRAHLAQLQADAA